MTIKELIELLDEQLVEQWNKYSDLHEEFNKFRGIELSDEQLEDMNKVLSDIQDTFKEIYPFFVLFSQRAQFCANAMQTHEEFIAELKKVGAEEVEN